MTVSSALNRKAYTGNGSTTSFATSPVVFFDSSDLDVYVVTTATGAETLLVENTDYTVAGGDGAVGTVSTAGGSNPYGAPSASQTLVIVRTLDITQEVDLVDNEATDADVAERALDRLTMIAQQNAASIARSFTLPESDVSGASTELPTPEASTYLGWDATGTALVNYSAGELSTAITVSAFAETLLDDTDAAAMRTTLGIVAGGSDIPLSTVTTAGDIIYATGAGAVTRLAVGTAYKKLAVNAGATAPEWVADTQNSVVTTAGDLVYGTANRTIARLPVGTAGQVLRTNAGATAPEWGRSITLGTEQASTSGTSIDFTGIPAGVRRITILLVGVSTNGTSNLLLQIGDAGGIETSGAVSAVKSEGTVIATSTAGFLLTNVLAAADVTYGKIVLDLEDASDFTWVATSELYSVTSVAIQVGVGYKPTSAELDRVRLTTAGGANTFDAGVVNISYE